MNVFYFSIFTLLLLAFPASSHGTRVKRDLSPDVQKKLVDELNKDRQELGKKTKLTFAPLKYNATLEKMIDGFASKNPCEAREDDTFHYSFAKLKVNDAGQKIIKENARSRLIHFAFFNPRQTSIACSKSLKCTFPYDSDPSIQIEFYGACILGPFGKNGNIDDEMYKKFVKAGIPSVSKYADIIGNGAASSTSYFCVMILIICVIFF
ncbi:hypothetical protein GCK72_012174 [Caenorhabditis remanei]|uniref:SCP domain-containing protein n=1 Tax=Caenorhabditis remanei TaxID=31234 RepID=A0A6A5GM72_CAERE|nr:hypothetical protein GCK72_012174 [Caenorhabditis remanei]KAF1755724.1 hypothetical protein GCK72_012174 [Caenorhabditis remanei]